MIITILQGFFTFNLKYCISKVYENLIQQLQLLYSQNETFMDCKLYQKPELQSNEKDLLQKK